MTLKRKVYVAFDFDDLAVKQSLIAESRRPDCPWEFVDNSISSALESQWTLEARRLIGQSEVVIVLCGEQTHQSKGVATEVQIAQQLGRRYFLLSVTRVGKPTKPQHTKAGDKVWTYKWPTLLTLLSGQVPPPDAEVR